MPTLIYSKAFLCLLLTTVTNNRIPGDDFDMIYYADDTVLFSRSNRGLHELLRLTGYISKGYGLRLNKGKCVAIAMNNDALSI